MDELNEQQRLAVTYEPHGALVVVAGPGSGKTKVVVHRIAHMIDVLHAAPSSIVLVTFTNKGAPPPSVIGLCTKCRLAAREMKRRVRVLVGDERATQIIMGTFHSVCARYLRKHGAAVGIRPSFSVLDSSESRAVIKRILDRLKMTDIPVDQMAHFISSAKNRSKTVDTSGKDAASHDRMRVFAAYNDQLRDDNSLDFDDLLHFGQLLFSERPDVLSAIRHVLVDEFQDTNELQYDLARSLCRTTASLTVVGDPDQSIYGWRHATASNLTRRLRVDYEQCETITLDTNYRSTSSIVRGSQLVIESGTKDIFSLFLRTFLTSF